MMARLTSEEREIVQVFETGTLQAPPNRSAILKAHREYAAVTLRKARQPPEAGKLPPEPE